MKGIDLRIDHCEHNPDWDQYVLGSEAGSFFQTSAWAQVKQCQGWNALRFILRSPAGDICGGAQVMYKKCLGLVFLLQLPFGPLYEQDRDEQGQVILDALKDHFQNTPFILFLQPHMNCWNLYDRLIGQGNKSSSQGDLESSATIIIDVSVEPEDILRQIKKGKRLRFRQSESRGLTCYETPDRSELDIFYALHQEIAEKRQFGIQCRDFFELLWDHFMPRGWLHLFIGRIDHIPVASIITITFGNTLHIYRVGWTEGHNNCYINEGMYWYIMRWAHEHNYHWVDLGGIDRQAAESVIKGEKLDDWVSHTYTSFKLHLSEQIAMRPGTVELVNPKALANVYRWLCTNPGLNQVVEKGYELIRKR